MDKYGHVPFSGERYRHFKGGLYQIVTIANHSETGEALVIYQALYGDYACYARPLGMFMGVNDNGDKLFTLESNAVESDVPEDNVPEDDVSERNAVESDVAKNEVIIGENELLFRILDCECSKDKLELIRRYRNDIDHKMLGNLAVSMDIPVDNEDDVIFEQIAQYLETRARFETDRLR